MTILMTLLIIALVIAIVFDAIRIMQYISFRKTIDKVNEELAIKRINEALNIYTEDMLKERTTLDFGEYFIEWSKKYNKTVKYEQEGKTTRQDN